MLWIAVPGGIKAGKALLRVLIVPKLDGGPLSRHGMAQWPPNALQQGMVRVEVHKPGATLQTTPDLTRELRPTIPFQSGLWELLMDRMTVEDARTLRAAPPGPLTVHKTSDCAQAVGHTLGVASREKVTAAISDETEKYLQKVRAALLKDHYPPPPGSHPTKAPPPPQSSPACFHRSLSMLREHPSVLRALGLIFELQLDANALSALAGGTIRVVWPGHSAPLPAVVSPRTRFGADFFPGSTPNLDAGMVTLDRLDGAGKRWTVVTVDVDVATQRLREAARAMHDRPQEPVTLPALRSGGLQLLLRGRGEEMQERLARAVGTQATLPDILTADDLVLGYRIDVLPELGGTTWFSLQQRNASYRVHRRLANGTISETSTAVGSAQMTEEGHIKANAAIHDESGLHADEIVAAWKGWSLAVPRPSFEQTPQATPPTQPGMNVSMAFEAAPGSLPGLRFGQQYTLRARVADIAGGGRELNNPGPDRYRTPVVFYGRYEPILAPDITVRDGIDPVELGPGEAIGHIVVRSDPTADLNITQYAARYHYRLDDQRLLRPPLTTQGIAEQHGVFDNAAARQTWEWARLAIQGALPDPAAGGIAVAEPRRGAPPIPPLAWDGPWHNPNAKTLHLTDRPTDRPQVAWEGGWLVVRLAPAEQITLQLSTFPKVELFGKFDASSAIPSDGTSADAARQGRHPVLSPTRTVTFVHAVQRPLRAPDTVLTAHRTPGQTFAALNPNSPLLDPKSTSQLDVTATWQDQVDDDTRAVRNEPVTTLTIDPNGPPQPSTLFRHEFGDTRHRTVTYTLHSVSRFRHYFRNSDTEPFTQTSTLRPVIIPSASRPPPPVVLSAKPAFEWKETGNLDTQGAVLNRQRLGTRIRLTLQPPWHCTGAGELLAVVVRPQSDGSAALDNVVSQAGHDPIYPSRSVPGGGPFARDITSGTEAQRTLWIPEAAADAVIKPHTPTCIRDDGCWVCDVALTAAFDHTFLQLAVARYQPQSLDGLWLSDVVKTDMAPLLPERTLRVTRQPGGFDVELIGAISTAAAVDRVDMILERCRRPGGIPTETVDLIGFSTTPDDVPAWVKTVVRSPGPSLAGPGLLRRWKTTFGVASGSGEFRVRIREVELIPNTTAQPGTPLQSGTAGEIKERTVFTDIVPLPVI